MALRLIRNTYVRQQRLVRTLTNHNSYCHLY